jgi:DNA-binding PadR family transcriptional regulator
MHRPHHPVPRFCGKHQGGRGPGARFGGWFAEGGDLGGRGFGMGRKLASTDLQLLILKLLGDKPRHGYEIIKALDERSKGFYAPSPGMVYPALTYLEKIGHALVASEGSRKLYRITAAGRRHLDEHRNAADALLAQFERVGERMEHLRRAMRSGAEHEAEGPDEERTSEPLLRAWRALKTALAVKRESAGDEQDRIAEVLRRAAEEIAPGAADGRTNSTTGPRRGG